MHHPSRHALALAVACIAWTGTASAAVEGPALPLIWGAPFAGLLLSLAIGPLIAGHFWHRHYGKVTVAWAAAFLLPFAAAFGSAEAAHQLAHALLQEYVPFVVLLFSLYTIAGGIAIRGTLVGTPGVNCGLLLAGCVLASVMGTTGAAMLLIRPLLRANEARRHRVHVVVFFIILVGNIGGALTPLGDPPLFIGFLKGIDFFWTTRALLVPTSLLAVALLAIFWIVDTRLRRDDPVTTGGAGEPLAVEGAANILLVIGAVAAVLASGVWKPGIELRVLGIPVALEDALRDGALLLLALVSLRVTPRSARAANAFDWGPIVEVAKLFAGIFVTVIPVIAMLQAGRSGALAAVVNLVIHRDGQPRDVMAFWITGILSAFLDNAPTYLVFFNLAGADPVTLMGPMARTLAMISAGAVYCGALTYIGNAPNLMIKAIAEDRGVAMPGFFTYLGIVSALLLPLFALVTWLYR